MRQTCILLIGLLLSAGRNGARADCPPPIPGQSNQLQNQFIIGIASYADPQAVFAMIDQQWPGTTIVSGIEGRAIYLLQPPPSVVDCDIVENLLITWVNPFPTIVDPSRPLWFAELNFEEELPEGHTGTIFIKTPPAQVHTEYQEQYALLKMQVPTAQARSTGRGTAVAVVDTGVDAQHDVLQGHVLPGFNFVTMSTDTNDTPQGLDTNGNGTFDELTGHGTYMAGLIALIAPETMILPVVVLDSDGRGDQFRLAQGIYYAIDHGVEVINLSLGSTDSSDLIEAAVTEARDRGILVVAAAGNRNTDSIEESPANDEDVISVAATDADDLKAPFSSYGHSIVLCAPGDSSFLSGGTDPDPNRSVFSSVPGGDGSDIASWEGSSLSTAFVSGAAALVRAQHPEWAPNAATNALLAQVLESTAEPIDALNPQYVGDLGRGRVAIGAAVAAGPVMPLPGDLNNDGHVDLTDLSTLLVSYGSVHSSADLNADGIVDLEDLARLLEQFGI